MFNRTAALALALALPLAACADDTADVEPVDTDADVMAVETDDTMMDSDDMMSDAPADDVTVDGTLQAVTDAGGLTDLAPGAAVANIDGWIAQLEADPAFSETVTDLRTLKDQLQTTPLDGAAIGATLSRLGEQTTAVAADNAGLQQLGDALSGAGAQLTGQ